MSHEAAAPGSSVVGSPFPHKEGLPDLAPVIATVRKRVRSLPQRQAIRQLTEAVVRASPHKVNKDMNDENRMLWWLA